MSDGYAHGISYSPGLSGTKGSAENAQRRKLVCLVCVCLLRMNHTPVWLPPQSGFIPPLVVSQSVGHVDQCVKKRRG